MSSNDNDTGESSTSSLVGNKEGTYLDNKEEKSTKSKVTGTVMPNFKYKAGNSNNSYLPRKRRLNDDDNHEKLKATKVAKIDKDKDVACSSKSAQSPENNDKGESSHNAAVVAEHYNNLEEKGLLERNESRIFHMRNFNNWIKTMLINEYMDKVRYNHCYGEPIKVLDMCCGKGGDLLKWKRANISHLICADIAEVSVSQCKDRYDDMLRRDNGNRAFPQLFNAEFITADCAKVRLREKYQDASIQLDLVSCQFALHYSFESLEQAECMIRNASENLKPGGYFIATIPSAADLVYQWRQTKGNFFGNEIYNVKFSSDDKDNIPLFGAKYNFHLEGVLDCPEFLVYLPLLKKIARKYGLEYKSFERFHDYYERFKDKHKNLLAKMEALETYPPEHGVALRGNDGDYKHADKYIEEMQCNRVGTLSLSEWEAISLYAVVSFRKLKTRWNAEGKPEYDN